MSARSSSPTETVARPPATGTETARQPLDGPALRFADLELWPGERQAFVSGHRIALTRREFAVLHVLATRAGHVLTRERIYELVWGEPMLDAANRSVDVYVGKLRLKLEAVSPDWRYLHTHHGLGYRFEPEAASAY